MSRNDWLVGGDRSDAAAERIYAGAADLIARHGYDAFTIDALAAAVHCSPATIYRHTGGKTAIREAVVARQALMVVAEVRTAIEGLTGAERVVTATVVALQRIRSDPLRRIMRTMQPGSDWLTTSPMVTALAAEMLGQDSPDPLDTQMLIRVFLALWSWPVKDPAQERALVERLLGPAFEPRPNP
ncbi:helix-turn-helix domain-containing protein [Mycobacterium sp. ACS4331]|uniref:TetR/AcrR family transcriptional regulator n=1 Tax=Mycobacterium sp. ACS4331 TaxID=1834121 RepID=UPI0007FD38CD|nr:helix-turn-helix domain-containing protein [Mycobacterium sp. ACS4331]OBF20663.1 transcriptional regulator [Mycobacterium sp. ACS4331]